ncbi:MAG: Hsp20/alpha crystallin family protein [Bacteroidaceae bacterium]|nr:Hsp20/alpha crystallin family protein [Bacteroidaceae bacterium]
MRQITTNNYWLPEIFNDFIDNAWLPKTKSTAPAINVAENPKDYFVEIAAPGMSKEDFNIQINEDNDLVIKMEKKNESQEDEKTAKTTRYLRREFSYSKYLQTLILPDDVDKKKISAKVENGILTITLPKLEASEEPKVSQQIIVS